MFGKKKNTNKDDIGLLEGIKVVLVLITAFALPTVPVTYILTKFAGLNIFLSIFVGLVVTLILIFALGWHKPAYENENKAGLDEDEDED